MEVVEICICIQNTNYAAYQHYVPPPLDIYGFTTNIDDVGRKRRYGRNILQWSKNDFKSKNSTNGDYCTEANFKTCLVGNNVRWVRGKVTEGGKTGKMNL